ncbi:Gag-pol fusion protein [Phytophthora megakarya]|uniref:Gag-pol fusion protein n=1 Tax=Phytophthora megakarya TaxID=4795 RepID=A0A225W723_9STRA|nr:Gag-pol fusion protein [Phytophthora megakarya]
MDVELGNVSSPSKNERDDHIKVDEQTHGNDAAVHEGQHHDDCGACEGDNSAGNYDGDDGVGRDAPTRLHPKDQDDRLGDDEGDPAVAGPPLQLTDIQIISAQKSSRFVQKLVKNVTYQCKKIETRSELVSAAKKACCTGTRAHTHRSVWSGHLRCSHTDGRVSQLYWWPKLQTEVNQWVRDCPECSRRKARPWEIIPPLGSIRGAVVGDPWALDVAGPFSIAASGDRYVGATVEYVTRYAVASCVERHTAESVATFLMEEVVLKFEGFRELMTDGTPEMVGEVIDKLVEYYKHGR